MAATEGAIEPGWTKVDVGFDSATGQGPRFVGMGKEELLKKANEPFWVRLRWALFIVFWGLWLAMLAGAVVIILNAPKSSIDCTEASTESSTDSGMTEKLIHLYGDLAGDKLTY